MPERVATHAPPVVAGASQTLSWWLGPVDTAGSAARLWHQLPMRARQTGQYLELRSNSIANVGGRAAIIYPGRAPPKFPPISAELCRFPAELG